MHIANLEKEIDEAESNEEKDDKRIAHLKDQLAKAEQKLDEILGEAMDLGEEVCTVTLVMNSYIVYVFLRVTRMSSIIYAICVIM